MRWLVLLIAGCSSGTSARLDVRYDDAWKLGGLEVEARDQKRTTQVAPSVRVLLRDDWAGAPLHVDVWGDRAGARFAHGKTTLTPVVGHEVAAEVVMSRLPCGAWCTLGATECQGDTVVTCVEQDADQCFVWASPAPCPSSAPFCSLGTCGAACVDECATGEKRCAGPHAVIACGQGDSDSCADWLAPVACADGEVCSGGECRKSCQDECAEAETQCLGAGVVTCGDLDADGCREWGPTVPCGDGMSCSAGACAAGCSDECKAGESRCQGTVSQACGQFDLDSCLEWSAGVSCVSSDLCVEGACNAGGCQSAPKVCVAPPASTCVDANTLRVYDSTGQCTGGTCDYTSHTVTCANCPACDACAGVSCDMPPNGCFAAAGSCSNGSCSYAFANGGSCSDGDACTDNDSCTSGVCSGTRRTCNTPPNSCYASTGSCSGGSCSYPFANGKGCDDGNACTTGDSCMNGSCAGAPKACNTPPNSCYLATGSCSGGTCSYSFDNGKGCDDGNGCTSGDTCMNGACAGSPVSCNTPPGPTCSSSTMVRTFSGPGTCSTGSCTYPFSDTACTSAPANGSPICAGGACDFACNLGFARVGSQCLQVTITAVALGGFHSCALFSDGTVKCWGSNSDGQLGNNSNTDSRVPVAVQGLTGATSIAAGHRYTCAAASGGVQCWGDNQYGQLGNNSNTGSKVPVAAQGLTGATAVEAGDGHVCALVGGGAVKCWGLNDTGQLGNNTIVNSKVPVSVQGLTGATAIAIGGYHSCALFASGTAQCWGVNTDGELGNNSTADSHVPVTVQGLTGASALAAGEFHTCALVSGSLKCWGLNDSWQLGSNTIPNSQVPFTVPNVSGATAVGLGYWHTCVLLSGGAGACWGWNGWGQLGNNSSSDSPVPQTVQGLSGAFFAAGGWGHTCAVLNGGVSCWGNNDAGELGNNSTQSTSKVPVAVQF